MSGSQPRKQNFNFGSNQKIGLLKQKTLEQYEETKISTNSIYNKTKS